jgi:hypothetical protein
LSANQPVTARNAPVKNHGCPQGVLGTGIVGGCSRRTQQALAADRPYDSSSRATFAWSSSFGAQGLSVAAVRRLKRDVGCVPAHRLENGRDGFVGCYGRGALCSIGQCSHPRRRANSRPKRQRLKREKIAWLKFKAHLSSRWMIEGQGQTFTNSVPLELRRSTVIQSLWATPGACKARLADYYKASGTTAQP